MSCVVLRDVSVYSSFPPPAALPKPCPGLAGCAAGLCALQPVPPGLHSVGDDRHPQSDALHSSSPEGQASASLLC